MTYTADLEKRLLTLDRELHLILNIVREHKVKDMRDIVEDSSGAWGYDVDSATFVEGLRKSKLLSLLSSLSLTSILVTHPRSLLPNSA